MLGGMSDATRILSAASAGDPRAAEQLLPLVYDELRKLAAARLAREKPGQTLQPTALVHEAYLRLVGGGGPGWNGRGHFFAAAAEAMRRILVERARRKQATKRGGDRQRVDLDEADSPLPRPRRRPARPGRGPRPGWPRDDPDAAELVKLRYFAGLTDRPGGRVPRHLPPDRRPRTGPTPGPGCTASSRRQPSRRSPRSRRHFLADSSARFRTDRRRQLTARSRSMSDQDRPRRTIFLAALERRRTRTDRRRVPRRACGGDAALRGGSRPCSKPTTAPAASWIRRRRADPRRPRPPPSPSGPGTVIGPYKLLEQIGEGGIGVVFMAEQSSRSAARSP